ncbi:MULTISPECIES: LysR substrate-binding domain-containing protein [Methylobacterium]|uniref:LysR family transcriptional regulator n=2 Tax=Methylobacterium TaxID=407 RepID=A0A0C6FYE8_9HYPH|nr:LysR substrate-binding domain-containing protein [Methylobacterium aquaticum]BAQ48410.1 LysR family transcriptional regulator [Methylobacterium aquaticum]
MHPLDIDQLRSLVAIAESGSFTRAAEAVHKTQSAVSMQMKRLEERIGREIFVKAGRGVRLTEDGERLLDYARRIVRLQTECLATFDEGDLPGRVRLGLPDDYADRYLPEILGRFARAHPRAEVTVVCEPSDMLAERIADGDIDLAIVTEAKTGSKTGGRAGSAARGAGRRGVETIRTEALLWVTSSRHAVHREEPVPLALGRPACNWRLAAIEALERGGRQSRILFVSWNSTAVGAAVLAGLAVSVLPESALRSGMRVLGPQDGFAPLPACRIGLMRHRAGEPNPLADILAGHIRQSLDNLALDGLAPDAPGLAAE